MAEIRFVTVIIILVIMQNCQRIIKAGGTVSSGRVFGNLAMSRALETIIHIRTDLYYISQNNQLSPYLILPA